MLYREDRYGKPISQLGYGCMRFTRKGNSIDFAKAEKELTAKGYSVVNPANVNAQLQEDTGYEEYMKMCFCMLDMCDIICMLKGWEKSCGANRELGYALAKDMIIMYE